MKLRPTKRENPPRSLWPIGPKLLANQPQNGKPVKRRAEDEISRLDHRGKEVFPIFLSEDRMDQLWRMIPAIDKRVLLEKWMSKDL